LSPPMSIWRTMTNTPTTNHLGEQLLSARQRKGWSLDEATFQARHRFPDLRIRRSKIARIEKGIADRDRLDVVVVLALAQLYDVPADDLDPSILLEAAAIRELVASESPCNPDPVPTSPIRALSVA
jgi:transcriptional regulator with XRE-family HTH domain